jgi:diadenosine tetraphosphate (Ap4A) HIT family hydrolase
MAKKIKIASDYDPKATINARLTGDYARIAKEQEESGRCIFCNPKEKYVIYKKDGWYLTTNIFPRSTGDLLVIPERHIELVDEMTEKDWVTHGELIVLGKKLQKEVLNVEANLVLTRQGGDSTIKHFHTHVQHNWSGLITWTVQENLRPALEIAPEFRKVLERINGSNS